LTRRSDWRSAPTSRPAAGFASIPAPAAKTQASIAKFLADHKLPSDSASKTDFFDVLLAAAAKPEGIGFSWCNDTKYPVMAALGVVEMGAIVSRGWYRIEPGKCLRPDLRGDPHRLYSYAEAVDGNGRDPARRCGAHLGRQCCALHTRRQVRVE
jgi:hypothetical protein